MTCSEFQGILPDLIDGKMADEPAAHLKSCAACSDLVADLMAISASAKLLQTVEEPSPRVWANLRRNLEAEGLVRAPRQEGGVLIPARRPWFSPAWLVPVAAVLVVGIGLFLSSNRSSTPGPVTTTAQKNPAVMLSVSAPRNVTDDDDQELLAQVAAPMRATYADNLRSVNASIQDAQDTLAQNPDDEEARHFLMDAYEQKAMVYELAMDNSVQ